MVVFCGVNGVGKSTNLAKVRCRSVRVVLAVDTCPTLIASSSSLPARAVCLSLSQLAMSRIRSNGHR